MSSSIFTAARNLIGSFRQIRPEAAPRQPPRGSQLRPWPEIDTQSAHSGRRLTIRKILRRYDLAECGDPREQCDLFDDKIENDAHLRSLLESRLESVTRKPWVIIPGGPDAADVQAAEELEHAVRDIPNFHETLEHQGKFNWYGWAASEIDWRRVDGTVVPLWFANTAPQRFRFDKNNNPILTFGDGPDEALRPGKWWLTCRNHRSIPCSGLMRTAAIFSHFKATAIRDALVFISRFGIPYVVASHESPAIQTELRTQVEKALKFFGTEGHAIVPESVKFEIHDVMQGRGGENVHMILMNFFDAQNSKLIAGATLMADTAGPGSFALGKVHQNRSFDLLLGDAARLSSTFERFIAAPFVHFNGMEARPPRLKIHLVKDEDPKHRAEVFGLAQGLGLDLDEDQVRNELQLKAPTGNVVKAPSTDAPTNPESSPPSSDDA